MTPEQRERALRLFRDPKVVALKARMATHRRQRTPKTGEEILREIAADAKEAAQPEG